MTKNYINILLKKSYSSIHMCHIFLRINKKFKKSPIKNNLYFEDTNYIITQYICSYKIQICVLR